MATGANTAFAGDDSPTQVFTLQHGLNYGESEPTEGNARISLRLSSLHGPLSQFSQSDRSAAAANQPVRPNQFGADDSDVPSK